MTTDTRPCARTAPRRRAAPTPAALAEAYEQERIAENARTAEENVNV